MKKEDPKNRSFNKHDCQKKSEKENLIRKKGAQKRTTFFKKKSTTV